MALAETKLEFDAWLHQLKAIFVAKGGMSDSEAQNYVFDNRNDWREYYDDEYAPDMAASVDMSYWGD